MLNYRVSLIALEYKMRSDNILTIIEANPGITYSELSLKTDTPLHSLWQKCSRLIKQNYIVTVKKNKICKLYPTSI